MRMATKPPRQVYKASFYEMLVYPHHTKPNSGGVMIKEMHMVKL